MANYAIIESEIVTNVIDAPSLEVAQEATGMECIECDGSFWIGWIRKDNKWINPSIEEITNE